MYRVPMFCGNLIRRNILSLQVGFRAKFPSQRRKLLHLKYERMRKARAKLIKHQAEAKIATEQVETLRALNMEFNKWMLDTHKAKTIRPADIPSTGKFLEIFKGLDEESQRVVKYPFGMLVYLTKRYNAMCDEYTKFQKKHHSTVAEVDSIYKIMSAVKNVDTISFSSPEYVHDLDTDVTDEAMEAEPNTRVRVPPPETVVYSNRG